MLENFRRRRLQSEAPSKPLDFGLGGLVGSINRAGRITSFNRYHPVHGYSTVTAAPPFDETRRYDPVAVRAYRRSLTQLDGFGLRFDSGVGIPDECGLLEDAVPYIIFRLADGNTIEILVLVDPMASSVFYWCRTSAAIHAVFDGQLWLQRCAYTQITEGGPLPMPPAQTRILRSAADGTTLTNPALAVSLQTNIAHATEGTDGSVIFDAPVPLKHDTVFTFQFGDGEPAPLEAQDAASLLQTTLETWHRRWQGWRYADHALDLPLRRALVYAVHCCIPVDDTICVITDHQLLPLSWTRDAYFTIMPLLKWQPEFADTTQKHLLWLFERAERPQGYWGRAYLANGKVKDPAMQLDQQLYPLLELADYVEISRDMTLWQRLETHVQQTLAMLIALRDSATGLFPTHETPADDPVHLPFHLSSHILFWHTLRKLAWLTNHRWDALADEIKAAIDHYFIGAFNDRHIYAYLTDGEGKHHFYHDANDLPLALAPLWGFWDAKHPIWRNTMEFAFSAANVGGYYGADTDSFAGLGSIHTPDAWHLGNVQEYLYAQQIGDVARQQRVIGKIAQGAQWDGALSEAYSAQTGEVVARHWFAWANAALHLCQWE